MRHLGLHATEDAALAALTAAKQAFADGRLEEHPKARKTKPGKPKPKKTSKHKGVSWNKGSNKWQVMIQSNGQQYNLGSFDDEDAAGRAYQAARAARDREELEGYLARIREKQKSAKGTKWITWISAILLLLAIAIVPVQSTTDTEDLTSGQVQETAATSCKKDYLPGDGYEYSVKGDLKCSCGNRKIAICMHSRCTKTETVANKKDSSSREVAKKCAGYCYDCMNKHHAAHPCCGGHGDWCLIA